MRPGRAMASMAIRNTDCDWATASAKPGWMEICGAMGSVLTAHQREEVDPRRGCLGPCVGALLVDPRAHGLSQYALQASAKGGILAKRVDQCRKARAPVRSAEQIGVADRASLQPYHRPRHRGLA